MNQRGMLILYIFIAFFILALLPPLIMAIFPLADMLIRLMLAIMIFATVRAYLGSSSLTLIISAALIYLLVIKHGYITASLYFFFYILLLFNFLSAVIWGLSRFARPVPHAHHIQRGPSE